jgi:hypothetical protein
MGNFLPMMICGMFAVFWLSFGTLQLPTWQIAESYSASGTNAAEGAATVGYNAGIALYLIVWGFTLATFFVFTLKTNTVFALIFFCVDVGVWCLSAAYWKVALGTVYRLDRTAFKNFKFDFEFSEFSATVRGRHFSLSAQRPREVQRNTEHSWIQSVK